MQLSEHVSLQYTREADHETTLQEACIEETTPFAPLKSSYKSRDTQLSASVG